MKIPSAPECYQLIESMQMMDHIRAHSEAVSRVAMMMAEELLNQNIRLNRDLIHASSLLHDITKTRSFETREDHAATGGKLLHDMGFPEVGDIIRQHVRLDRYLFRENPTEAEIVNYSDKRVLHDRIVSLEIRMDYILERYGKNPFDKNRIRRLMDKSRQLEDKLFKFISFSPEDLTAYVSGQN